LTFKKLTLKLL